MVDHHCKTCGEPWVWEHCDICAAEEERLQASQGCWGCVQCSADERMNALVGYDPDNGWRGPCLDCWRPDCICEDESWDAYYWTTEDSDGYWRTAQDRAFGLQRGIPSEITHPSAY